MIYTTVVWFLARRRCRDLFQYNCRMTFTTLWKRRPSQKFIRVSWHTTVVSQQSR